MPSFNLPIAPSANNAFVNRRFGHGYGRTKSLKHRAWLKNADAWYVMQRLGRHGTLLGPYSCRMWFAEGTRGDLDGRQKLIIDFLVSRKLVQGDDPKYLRKCSAEFSADVNPDLVLIEIKAMRE